MGNTDNKIILYSSQASQVIDVLERDGVCFSKRKYVEKKYGECAPIFTTAYSWFVFEAQNYLSKPQGAEYPYWAFRDTFNVDQSMNGKILKLQVPIDEAVFFDMYDWNKILCLKYIGENEDDERQFKRTLSMYGVRTESDAVLSNFYPDLKRQIQNSWKRLFRYDKRIKNGDTTCVKNIQSSLWQIKKEWII